MDATSNRGASPLQRQLLVGAMAVATTVGAAGFAAAATDAFLKIGDIQGDSTDDRHPGEIVVLAWSWGASGATGGDSKKGVVPACGQPLIIDKNLDRATPVLVTGAGTGAIYPAATLVLRKAGREQQEFLSVTLNGASVKSIQTGGPDATGFFGERLALNYASAKIEYKWQKPDGSLDAGVVGTAPASCP